MTVSIKGPYIDTHFGTALHWFIDDMGQKWKFDRTMIQSEYGFELSQLKCA